jgi:multisubunit Na+/H+ antiporter MnhE subunit
MMNREACEDQLLTLVMCRNPASHWIDVGDQNPAIHWIDVEDWF